MRRLYRHNYVSKETLQSKSIWDVSSLSEDPLSPPTKDRISPPREKRHSRQIAAMANLSTVREEDLLWNAYSEELRSRGLLGVSTQHQVIQNLKEKGTEDHSQ